MLLGRQIFHTCSIWKHNVQSFGSFFYFFQWKKEQTSEIMGKTDASLFKLKEEMKSQIKNEIENMGDTLGLVAF